MTNRSGWEQAGPAATKPVFWLVASVLVLLAGILVLRHVERDGGRDGAIVLPSPDPSSPAIQEDLGFSAPKEPTPRLTTAPRTLRETCRRAAAHVGSAVPCPAHLPRGSFAVPCEQAWPDTALHRIADVCLPDGSFGLTVDVPQGARIRIRASAPDEPCTRVIGRRAVPIGERTGTLTVCGDRYDIEAEDVVLEWAVKNLVYRVSASGPLPTKRDLVTRIAEAVEPIQPP